MCVTMPSDIICMHRSVIIVEPTRLPMGIIFGVVFTIILFSNLACYFVCYNTRTKRISCRKIHVNTINVY
ncbi:protein TE36 [Testudinid alphaherpesvirus 3]|uniref:Protein TE36 n=1 Tax=Testudinid alphaherpesvirus 3 TaxID=2560801 RepID=A0A0M3LD12_9ALPH|nr:protein TE36 [Testudinid alphaherpesvirus 3]AIU39345.1 protein TE36 [Testudinid alphaherpesvirus 3]AIU39439.1 protein TE36 [Testudinid alphaherpesvirus 3]AKI81714.1 protein TE36 [Testudinid alphaherpesvirus 3]AKI81815.1 protein TE36 [Testudinid alphaherpesvirus 3]